MPLGWMVVVSRQYANRMVPAAAHCPRGERIAIWQTDLLGIDWLDALDKAGDARFLAFNGGYPYEYTAQAKHLLPRILDKDGPPLANPIWKIGVEDVLAGATPSRIGRTVIDHAVAQLCAPEEWLFVEAWDGT